MIYTMTYTMIVLCNIVVGGSWSDARGRDRACTLLMANYDVP